VIFVLILTVGRLPVGLEGANCFEESMGVPYAMVVEDDEQVAGLFQKALQDAGYRAEIMDNGHKAQANLMFTNPDLVLVDLHLPRLDGGTLIRQIRKQTRLVHTRVVLITADSYLAERYAADSDATLVKPVGYEQVRRVAQQLSPISI
jgi:DNA-binding response OmpR family regulator